MKRALLFVKRNFAVLFLDILSVNAAYYAALLLRFFVHDRFDKVVYKYLGSFYQFAPFYTVLCLLVFFLFKLYNGMWRYAGINDMNRIIGANLVTALIQVVGTALFIRRMPLTYYLIGATLQFGCIVFTRFVYRFYLIEKNKIASRNAPSINVMIIGANEMGRRVIRNLLGNTALRAVCFLDGKEKDRGKSFDGIPVYALDEISKRIKQYGIKTVVITDNALTDAQRDMIREKSAGIELVDYTGILSNTSGAVSLTSLLEMTQGPVTIQIDQESRQYENGMQAIHSLHDRYDIESVAADAGRVCVTLKKAGNQPYSGYDEWAKQYKEQTGEDVSFF